MTGPALVVALANARAPRRPPHARAPVAHDALADAASATALLEPLIGAPVRARDLAAVRAVQRSVVAIVDALIEDSPPPLRELNALAARESTTFALEPDPSGGLGLTVRPNDSSSAAALRIAVMRELAELEPSRLRRCARPECSLVFYDVTRSGTQRWHAESPCGTRERQRRHRARVSDGFTAPTGETPS